ncbi:MAG: hypothetical protein CL537_08110 [Alcanivoracaceae bacterium]|nr:hypothetical protein [Alcanivoracaceae bacterium]
MASYSILILALSITLSSQPLITFISYGLINKIINLLINIVKIKFIKRPTIIKLVSDSILIKATIHSTTMIANTFPIPTGKIITLIIYRQHYPQLVTVLKNREPILLFDIFIFINMLPQHFWMNIVRED